MAEAFRDFHLTFPTVLALTTSSGHFHINGLETGRTSKGDRDNITSVGFLPKMYNLNLIMTKHGANPN